jgi:hypothetical protein
MGVSKIGRFLPALCQFSSLPAMWKEHKWKFPSGLRLEHSPASPEIEAASETFSS